MAQEEMLLPGAKPGSDSSIRPEALPGEPRKKGDYEQHHEDGEHHIVQPTTYYKIFGALMVLLIITVLAAELDMAHYGVPWLNVIIALAIAVAKAVLIVMYFMHVKFSSRLVWIFVITPYLFITLMFSFAYGDFFSRNWIAGFGH